MTLMVGRQAIFSGTEPAGEPSGLDLERLARFLRDRIGPIGDDLTAVRFKGGQSNPTYLLQATGGRWVLRRRPPGVLVAGAHAIDREFRVLKSMAACAYPAPLPILYCEDEAVIGSAFYLARYVEGRVFWNADLPGVQNRDRAVIYNHMNAGLAALHGIDPAAAGLADLGRGEGYAARNLSRWSRAWAGSKLVDIPDMDWLAQTLPDAIPERASTAFIHGDYGLSNLIFDSVRPRLLAVLDWEMATLGDQLIDLAHHLRPWWEPPEKLGAATSLVGRDLTALGIPSMDEYVAAYCARRSLPVPDMAYYLAHAQFRYAAMVQGILKRASDGSASSRRILHTQDRVIEIARLARRTLQGD